MENSKIGFALTLLEEVCKEDDSWYYLEGYVRCDQIEEFSRISNVIPEYGRIWDDEFGWYKILEGEGYAGEYMAGGEFDPKALAAVKVAVNLCSSSNMTQGFYRATGVQLDFRFL
ncbi:MAG: hypothetical protein LBL08_03845 [Candidatus Nomurabacteria bacterium]|jgi:hypothetical protein|nr:hypothetical protein [Candidatus Nomurabacteria bacterium]